MKHVRPAVGVLLLALLVAACPRPRRPGNGALPTKFPAVMWSIQLEGDPWPHGIVGDSLLVWTYRFAESGFLFPIKLESYSPTDGNPLWSVPMRPWLRSVQSPWSFTASHAKGIVGAWVKGDVARALTLRDRTDAWSIPQCGGLLSVTSHFVLASEQTLQKLNPLTGRTELRIPLAAPLAAPPVLAGGRLVVLLSTGRLVGMDSTTGKILWQRALPPHRIKRAGWPTAAGSIFLLPYGAPPKGTPPNPTESRLEARSADTGRVIWRKTRLGSSPEPTHANLRQAGDLLLWLDPAQGCVRGLELTTGRQRFRTCGLRLTTPPIRHGMHLYALGDDKKSREALTRGEPWYVVDFPVLSIDITTGRASPVTLAVSRGRRHSSRRRKGPRSLRAIRLQLTPVIGDVLYMIRRHRYLTALGLPRTDVTPKP